ncbi:isoprenylcysteine carboxylmethyltransferase family protein [Colwellia sp. E2M01]|uniref:methyltransferase family protein n=1 Tax=Colwellia sp. E2M01 TaxID=2841561 RepID=UPI001C09374E|nr:isoprenylcysteine carboxylmethyltransferase family protein [Colwellia sp. E2M01]MBU2869506.1 isoprenylcysteine carboxylmethyltransferase family protein [Colwellia sp. E2M01]
MAFLENKIPPPLVGIIIAAIMWWLSTVTPVITISQLIKFSLIGIFICIGAFFDLAGVISFRLAKTTVNPLKPDKASSLVTSGIYQYTRNPMYVGFVAFLLAWASFLGSVWSVALIGFYIAYIQRFQIMPEERALTVLFKEEFIAYKNKVRVWL